MEKFILILEERDFDNSETMSWDAIIDNLKLSPGCTEVTLTVSVKDTVNGRIINE